MRCKCFPSQDTTKQPYRVVVCLDMRTGVPYGAHCGCISGLGEACTHVAGLFFALEDFVSRGFHTLPDGQSTTEVLCAWSASKSHKVEARPLRTVPIIKAVSGGRKETTKWDRELNFSNYDPREEKHRKPGMESLLNVSHRLVERGAGDCNFARFLTHKRKRSHSESETVELSQPTQPTCLPKLACDEDIPISSAPSMLRSWKLLTSKGEMFWFRKDSPSSSLQQEYCQSGTLKLWTICRSMLAELRRSWDFLLLREMNLKAPLAHRPRVTFGMQNMLVALPPQCLTPPWLVRSRKLQTGLWPTLWSTDVPINRFLSTIHGSTVFSWSRLLEEPT